MEEINIERHEPVYEVTAICEAPKESGSPLAVQVGGSHYKNMKIQPIEFCMANNLNACQTIAIRYICCYKSKNGAEDIDKAIHTLQILKQLEYGSKD